MADQYGITCGKCGAKSPPRPRQEEADNVAGKLGWGLGLDDDGLAHYACPSCLPGFFLPVRIPTQSIGLGMSEEVYWSMRWVALIIVALMVALALTVLRDLAHEGPAHREDRLV